VFWAVSHILLQWIRYKVSRSQGIEIKSHSAINLSCGRDQTTICTESDPLKRGLPTLHLLLYDSMIYVRGHRVEAGHSDNKFKG
jgi:hypothetical protein